MFTSSGVASVSLSLARERAGAFRTIVQCRRFWGGRVEEAGVEVIGTEGVGMFERVDKTGVERLEEVVTGISGCMRGWGT